jgi:glycopeptide antibiotics resistance protein
LIFTKIIKPSLFIIAVFIPFWIAYRLYQYKFEKKDTSALKEITLFLCFVYLVVLLVIAVIPFRFTVTSKAIVNGLNFIPVYRSLKGLTEAYSNATGLDFLLNLYFVNVVGNITMFMPFGILLPLVSTTFNSLKRVIFAAFFTSLSIELTQLFFYLFKIYRYVDVDDVICNTMGAALGYLLLSSFRTTAKAASRLIIQRKKH